MVQLNTETERYEDDRYDTIEECEAVLIRMAGALAPANVELQTLAATLADLGGNVDAGGSSPLANSSANGEQDQAASKLAQAEARYRALIEQIPAISFLAPLDGSTSELYVSPQIETMLGFTAEEWLGNPILWYSQLHPDDQERWQAGFARTINNGEHFKDDYRFISKDGRIVWVHGEARVVSDEMGRPLFLQGVAFDITESKSAEEKTRLQLVNVHLAKVRDEALEASKAKSAFLANMSHELRTPLNAIVGFTEMLQEDAEDAGQNQLLPDLKQIHSSAKHLLGTIGGILDLSKIEAGRMDLFLESFDLSDMLRDVIGSALPLVEENENTLEVECNDDVGEMLADMTKVRQILFNLISNAAKFTTSGIIGLTATRIHTSEDDWIRIQVADSGIGMTPEQLAKLFQSFAQADVSTTRKYGGTGLGLAITQRFCEMMGGRIEVASEAAQGTTFTIHLPAIVVPIQEAKPIDLTELAFDIETTLAQLAANKSPVQAPIIASLPAPAPVVAADVLLVIDGDPLVRALMSKTLADPTWEVLSAANRVEGLATAKRVKPAAITLNPFLDETEGWALLSELKADPMLADVPIFLTSLADERGTLFAVSDYLNWPSKSNQLTTLLKRHRGTTAQSRLLVIDDEPTHRAEMSRIASSHDWTVLEAESGRAALMQVAESPPELILLDMMTPDMNGFELVRMLRRSQAGKSIPIIMLTPPTLTAESCQALSLSVGPTANKSAIDQDEFLSELRKRVSAAMPSGKAEEPSEAMLELQRELNRVLAERDNAELKMQELVRQTAEEKAEWQTIQDALALEAESAGRQEREQRQSIEYLQSEYEESIAKAAEADRLRAEVERLEDQLATRNNTPTVAEPFSAQIAELTYQKENVTRELEVKQRQNRDFNEELTRTRAALMEMQTRRDTPPEQPPTTPKPRSKPTQAEQDRWYISYRDEAGRVQRKMATVTTIVELIADDQLPDPSEILACRSKGGPFDPLTNFPEFRDLAVLNLQDAGEHGWETEWDDLRGSGGTMTATQTRPLQRSAVMMAPPTYAVPPREATTSPLLTLVLPLVVAFGAAIVAFKLFLTN